MARLRLVGCALAFVANTVMAIEAAPLAADPVLEARVLDVAAELRCLVCQNETLAASQSELALDLRKQIGQQLAAGKTPEQIRHYMVERYGDFVLYRPAFNAVTALLWLGPFALMVGGIGMLWRNLRGRERAANAGALDPSDRLRARQLLENNASRS